MTRQNGCDYHIEKWATNIHEESITWKNPRREKLESPDYLERLINPGNKPIEKNF